MTVYDVIIRARIELLSKAPVAAPNQPPVWDQQPNPVFTNGTASNYELDDLTSDPDDDTVTVSLNTGAVSLPTGVTWNDTLDRLEYDGAGAVASTSGHIATASDGTDTTDSNTFNIIIQEAPASVAIGFPRLNLHHIGGRSESSQWTDPAFHAKIAVYHQAQLNFREPDVNHAAQAVADIKAINPEIRLATYRKWNGFLVTSPTQAAARDYIVNNFTTTAIPPYGTATDGMARQPDGTIVTDWPNVEDLNHTDFPNLFNGQVPLEWNAQREMNEYYTGTHATTFDDIYWDIWRWFPRYPDRHADWNRDGIKHKDYFAGTGAADYENFDPTETNNAAIIRGKELISALVQATAQTERGTNIELLGNIGSWSDWFDGGQAQNDVIMSAPSEMVAITNGGMIENFGKVAGFNPDGTDKSGGFERAYKDVQRLTSWINTSTVTNTKRVWTHVELLPGLYQEAAYLLGVTVLAGAYFGWTTGADHKNIGELDEYYGQDASGMTTAQKVAALGWLGQPIGTHPEYGDTFSSGVNGGIFNQGVYAMEFDNGLVVVNPKGNGNKSNVILPTGTWDYFTGGQQAVNSGLQDVTSISILDAQSLFFKRGT